MKFRLARRSSDSSVMDVIDWKTRMADLQGIMSVAQALYLLLETHHEAIVRVALELALEPEVRRILYWENWYHESQRREGFRQKVLDKLQRVFRMLDVQVPTEQWANAAPEIPAGQDGLMRPRFESDGVKKSNEEVSNIPSISASNVERKMSRAKPREDKGVQADDGEQRRLEAQLEAMFKERAQRQQEIQQLQEANVSLQQMQRKDSPDQQESERSNQAQKQFEEQQRELEFLREVQKRFEQQQLEVIRLEKAQKQFAVQQEELKALRQAQKTFEEQSVELKRVREEHQSALHRADTLEAEQKQIKEDVSKKNTAMKEMQVKLQNLVQESEEAGLETEAVVKRLMKKVGLTDEVIRTELVWVRLYRDAMERLQRMAARREDKKQEARQEQETREAQEALHALEEFMSEQKKHVHAGPLGAWLSPTHGASPSPSPKDHPNGSPKSSLSSPKRRAFLEPDTAQVHILQAPRRCVRKLQNSRSAPAMPR